ncbi:MAG: translation initiation factor IF-2 [Candidatus Binatus sp.]|uniref:translation initiation factor IF-2 n=1 Tax=Candidatus Binatus sp. TaxID=2811406 RepID=UPI00271C5E07|nr:translation initiation factor IF-2 [Candidatus Binatus sp.]MDO8434174.1 translation initiation factor IF-2 [Candidatus Binatus sp.]
MARKRIKTLAADWGHSVEELLASSARLKLGHGPTESSLLSPEEADRLKADLDEQAHRATILRRETVLETSTGKILEKRLTATVMRRRHTEPGQSAANAEAPFHFEVENQSDESFVSPFLDEAPEPALEAPIFVEPEPGTKPAIQAAESASASEAALPAESRPAEPEIESQAEAMKHYVEPLPEPEPEPVIVTEPEARPVVEALAPAAPPEPQAPAAPSSRFGYRTDRVRTAELPARSTINLTRGSQSGPTLDDGQKGPKVLGRIDLRPKAPVRPAMAPSRPGGPPASRPGLTGRFATQQQAPQAPADGMPQLPPDQAAKPGGGRGIKKKKVVKKGSTDLAAEREMRGLRVPKKRRALPGKEQRKTEITTPRASKRVVRITEGVTVGDLGRSMGVKAGDLIKKLMELGQMATLNQTLDVDTATLLASEFGYSVENVSFDAESAIEETTEEVAAGESVTRPPVVTVMGHVDHGKTSLLDAIRHTNVTAREFGGITQHIGAYTVESNGRKIAFVDTPGHEAFTAMRARGAKVTDIVILVVAANEGVMPQTQEAVAHARAAKVPIIVAINKIDLPDANLDRVKQRLTEIGLVPEDYGGDTITVPVSARTSEGIDRLLEMVLLQADVMDLKANPNRPARGTIVESQLDRGRGPVATVLVQEGTLHQGDAFVSGTSYGRVRAMQNHLGQRLAEAGPSTPVEIFGLSNVPEPGTVFTCVVEESKARQVAEYRRTKQREGELAKTSRISLEDLSQRMAAGEVKELKVILKGDVQGSVEALADSLQRLSTPEVKLEVIHQSAGAISETDVTLASASKGIVIGFNIRPEPKAAALAEKEGVEIRLYTVIYEAINDMREAMEGLLAPTYREKSLGRAEVRKTFNVPGATVAGAMVLDGKLVRSARSRLVRDGRQVWEGKLASLKRFKDDAREVAAGYECGVALENFNDVKPGDIIEAFEMEAILRKLEAPRPQTVRGQAAVEKQLQT